jgi:putative peptidoglycan lipid II flippase
VRSANFLRAFLVSVLGTGLSRVLGMVRDVAVAQALGAGAASDAFWTAFLIPNTFRKFVADEGLTGSLIPALAQAERDGEEAARTLADRVFSALLIANFLIVSSAIVFAEPLVLGIAWGFRADPEKLALTVSLTRWMMPLLAMISVVSFYEGMLNHRQRFFVPKVAPALVSLGMAGAVGVAALTIGPEGRLLDRTAWAITAGVWVGGVTHVLAHLPSMRAAWGRHPHLDLGFGDPRFRAVMRELGKVVVIGLFAQLNIVVLRQLASFMAEGAVTRYGNATRMADLAQGLFAVGIASAILPNLSSAVSADEWGRFRADLLASFRLAAFLLLPASVGVFVYAVPLTAMLFLGGRYTWQDVLWTATALQLLAPFIVAVGGINILKKVFFALGDRNALLAVGAFGVALTGGTGWMLLHWDVLGLSVALSVATLAQLVVYVGLLRVRLGDRLPFGELVGPFAQMALATGPMAGVAYWAALQADWSSGRTPGNLAWFVGGLVAAAVVYALGSWLLGVEELTRLVDRVRARVRR